MGEMGVVGSLFEKLAPDLLAKIASSMQRTVDEIRVQLQNLFEDHLEFALRKCEIVKTIVSDERPVDIRSIYVNLNFKDGKKTVSDQHVFSRPSNYPRLIVKGTAGSGKTIFMKYFVLQTIIKSDRIPIFIDLRDIDDPREKSFVRSVFSLCTPESKKAEYGLFDAGLRVGLFSFFFDGLDEVNPNYRDKTFHQMQRFPFDFPKIEVSISSRPETDTNAFSIFPVLHLQKMNKDQVIELLKRTEFHDPEKLLAFIDLVDNKDFFRNRSSFLSIPLLALLMLLVFSDTGEIPERASVFYDQAFDTLYSRHDSSKGPFKRVFKSELPKDKFRQAFRLFCYRSLAHHQVSFSPPELKSHIERVINILELESQVDDIIHDLLESVCVMHRDEGKILFIHRSFQEYFAADFMSKWQADDKFELMDTILSDPIASRAAPLLYDIDEWAMEEFWVVPVTKILLNELLDLESSTLGMVEEVGVAAESGSFSLVAWRSGDKIFSRVSSLATVYQGGYPELVAPQLSEFSAVPEFYADFRDFVRHSPLAPSEYKKMLRDEMRQREKARVELKSKDAVTRGFWPLVVGEDHEEWLRGTGLLKILPRIRVAVAKLHEDVSQRVSARQKVDILR